LGIDTSHERMKLITNILGMLFVFPLQKLQLI